MESACYWAEFLLGGDENIVKLESGDGRTAPNSRENTELYVLKGQFYGIQIMTQ